MAELKENFDKLQEGFGPSRTEMLIGANLVDHRKNTHRKPETFAIVANHSAVAHKPTTGNTVVPAT